MSRRGEAQTAARRFLARGLIVVIGLGLAGPAAAQTVPRVEVASSSTSVAVGARLEVAVEVFLAAGRTPDLTLSLTNPPGLVAIDAIEASADAGVLCSLGCATPTIDGPRAGGADWRFGDVDVPAGGGALRLRARLAVDNVAAAAAGAPLSPRWTAAGASADGPTWTVVEPSLALRWIGPNTAADGGDTVATELELDARGALAHELVVELDRLDGLALAPAAVAAGTCPSPTVTATTGGVRLTLATGPSPGTTCRLRLDLAVPDTTAVGRAAAPSARARWTSLAGDRRSPASPASAVSTERTGDPADPGGAENDHTATATLAVPLSGLLVASLGLEGSSSPRTSGSLFALGETSDWRLGVRLAEGLHPDLVVRVRPPPGLALVATELDRSGFGGVVPLDPAGASGGSGAEVELRLGDVRVFGNQSAADDAFAVRLRLRAVDDAGVLLPGPSLRVSVRSTGREAATLAPFAFALPGPRLELDVNPVVLAGGELGNLLARVTNLGLGPVCGIELALALPPGLIALSGTTARSLGCLDAGELLELPVVVRVADGTPTVTLEAAVTMSDYDSLDVGGLRLGPLDDRFDNDGELGVDEAGDGRRSAELLVRAPGLRLEKRLEDLDGGALEPGDRVRWTLVATNAGPGRARGVELEDALPAIVVPEGPPLSTVGTATRTGDTVRVSIAELFASQTATVVIEARLLAPLAAGTPLSNQATARQLGGYPDVPSDDPSTPAPADATLALVAATLDPDGDGVPSTEDPSPNDPRACGDLDRDACDDCAVRGLRRPLDDGDDADGDGLCDVGERLVGTSVGDADSDDDGVPDGLEPAWRDDVDGDLRVGALDPDADDDGVLDGTELGLTTPHADTALAAGAFRPDLDPSTTTSATTADTDGGGVSDGGEDANANGRVDRGETDPLLAADDGRLDSDADGLLDDDELGLGTNPRDADSDDDGVLDGDEPDRALDVDGDGRIGPLDPDSDGDGLFDGTELGVTTPHADTATAAGFFIADADPLRTTSATIADTDGGGVLDGDEDDDRNGRVDPGELDPRFAGDDELRYDPDGDGLVDLDERRLGTDPRDADSDDDGVLDGAEPGRGFDGDGDGLAGALDPDSDGDGLLDGTEMGVIAPHADTATAAGFFVADADPTTTTNPLDGDSDRGGVRDGDEDDDRNGRVDPGELDPNDGSDDGERLDSDGDGLSNADEIRFGSFEGDRDSDDDGVLDGDEPAPGVDLDGDGLLGVRDPDSDGDGLFDGTELGVTTPTIGTDLASLAFVPDADPSTRTDPTRADTDGGGVPDGDEDDDKNGRVDPGELDPLDPRDDFRRRDTDRDGLTDDEEAMLGTDPTDADSDDDGVPDGDEPGPGEDTDGDGRVNARDPDSDGDGVLDGTELGVTEPTADTDLTRGFFVPDADPRTRSDPRQRDTDGGGTEDGIEDVNRDGAVEPGESDPTEPSDDREESDLDADGLSDAVERRLGSNPLDSDSDDDGVPDGAEPDGALDVDGDGLIGILDPDSDDDRVFDGTELGLTRTASGTDPLSLHFVADADPTTTTFPLLADSDGGGAVDGAEDTNHDGRVDPGELDPRRAEDDVARPDRDGDGLPDAEESALGLDPDDADSDDDGLRDGEERSPSADLDGDGRIGALDPDSDGDGVLDGTEAGVTDPGPDTDRAAGAFVADADPSTTTNPLLADTDRGGIADGAEDVNRDGRVDGRETDPRDPSDDSPLRDADGDGISDAEEGLGDTDGDGTPDFLDRDSDGDTILDRDEAGDRDVRTPARDTDGDGRPDFRDLDSDGDGISDRDEAGDDDPATRPADHDFDEIPDFADQDSDDDLILDRDEAGDARLETPPLDTDGDGTPDFVDVDSDDDTISDFDESGDLDPLSPPVDTDGDGAPDLVDLDSDDDGVPDAAEAGDVLILTPPFDTDRDGLDDYRDPDADEDGVGDAADLCPLVFDPEQRDLDGDGRGDACDGDRDGDGVPDARDRCPSQVDDQSDRDGDGLGDLCDPDADGDGWADGLRLGGSCAATHGGDLTLALLLLGLAALRRRRRRAALSSIVGLGLGLGTLLVARPGHAQGLADPRVLAADRFQLATDARGLLDVEWAEVTPAGSWDFAFYTDVSDAPLVLRDGDDAVAAELVELRVGGGLGLALGILDWAQLGLELPIVWHQTRQLGATSAGETPAPRAAGIGDLRLVPKLRLLTIDTHGLAVALVPGLRLPSAGGDDSHLGDGLSAQPELLLGWSGGAVRVALNLGARFRRRVELLGLIVDDELLARGAASLSLGPEASGRPLEIALRASLATPLDAPFAGAGRTALELGAFVAWRFEAPVTAFAALGGAIGGGASAPALRGSVGVRLHDRERDVDADRLPDRIDVCPTEPEDRDGFMDQDGCPDLDDDGDGIPDAVDRAPREPEDFDGFEDEDGAPEPDNDRDGVLDGADRCPTVSGPARNGGCPDLDSDGDGVADRLDRCPRHAEDRDGFEDEDGCPEIDNDRDGLLDAADACPREAGPIDRQGCPLPDRDGDGLPDPSDRCPEVPGPAANGGCPRAGEAPRARIKLPGSVRFEPGKTELGPAALRVVETAARELIDHPEVDSVELIGWANDPGDGALRRALSLGRAVAVRDELVRRGVPPERLRVRGAGPPRSGAGQRVDLVIVAR